MPPRSSKELLPWPALAASACPWRFWHFGGGSATGIDEPGGSSGRRTGLVRVPLPTGSQGPLPPVESHTAILTSSLFVPWRCVRVPRHSGHHCKRKAESARRILVTRSGDASGRRGSVWTEVDAIGRADHIRPTGTTARLDADTGQRPGEAARRRLNGSPGVHERHREGIRLGQLPVDVVEVIPPGH